MFFQTTLGVLNFSRSTPTVSLGIRSSTIWLLAVVAANAVVASLDFKDADINCDVVDRDHTIYDFFLF